MKLKQKRTNYELSRIFGISCCSTVYFCYTQNINTVKVFVGATPVGLISPQLMKGLPVTGELLSVAL